MLIILNTAMLSPYSSIKTIEDVASIMEKDVTFLGSVVDNVLFVAKRTVDPFPEDYVLFDRNDATVAGLYVKQIKFWEDFYDAYKSKKTHLCVLLSRVLYEAFIKMKYLIKYGEDAQKCYRLYSFKNRYVFYKEAKEYPQNGYTYVRNRKFLLDLKNEGFTVEDLDSSRKSFGGKNMRQLIEEIDDGRLYTSLYAMMSDSIHSDWGEIRQMYLRWSEEEEVYCLKEEEEIHERLLIPLLQIIIESSESYIQWTSHIHVLYDKVSSLLDLLQEMRRVTTLIGNYIMAIYMKKPDEFMVK